MNFKLLFPTYRTRFQFVRQVLDRLFGGQPVARGLNLGSGEGDYDPAIKRMNVASLFGNSRVALVRGDFCDQAELTDLLRTYEVDRIVHLGGYPGVRYSVERPEVYQQVNAVGTLRRVMEEYGDGLVRLDDASGRKTSLTTGRYVSIRQYCQLRLSALPPEALALYRGQVDDLVHRQEHEVRSDVRLNRVQAVQRRADGRRWTAGIQHPREPDAYLALAALEGLLFDELEEEAVQGQGSARRFLAHGDRGPALARRVDRVANRHSGQEPLQLGQVERGGGGGPAVDELERGPGEGGSVLHWLPGGDHGFRQDQCGWDRG